MTEGERMTPTFQANSNWISNFNVNSIRNRLYNQQTNDGNKFVNIQIPKNESYFIYEWKKLEMLLLLTSDIVAHE